MKPKLTLVTGIFPPDIGGPASYVPTIARAFYSMGIQPEVITLSDEGERTKSDDQYPFKVIRIRRTLTKWLRIPITVLVILKSARKTGRMYVNGLNFESAIVCWLLGIKPVFKIVGDLAWEKARNNGWYQGTIDSFQHEVKGTKLKILEWVRTWPLKFSGRIIVPSQYLKGIVAGWGISPSRIQVIYNAVDRIEVSPKPSKAEPTVITVCRLVPWKGIAGLLAAMEKLPQLRLIIVGDGPLRKDLETQCHEQGISKRVTWTGNLSRHDTLAQISNANIFVLNSTYEGLPHVVLEAMACHVPVIATHVGGTPEIVKHDETGLLVPPHETLPLIHAIQRIHEEVGLADRLIFGADQMMVGEFSAEIMFEKTAKAVFGNLEFVPASIELAK